MINLVSQVFRCGKYGNDDSFLSCTNRDEGKDCDCVQCMNQSKLSSFISHSDSSKLESSSVLAPHEEAVEVTKTLCSKQESSGEKEPVKEGLNEEIKI